MEEFNIQNFKELYEKDSIDTLLKLNDFITEIRGKLEISEKEKSMLSEKNAMLVESNSRLFLRVGQTDVNPDVLSDEENEPTDLEKELKEFGNKMLDIKGGKE